MLSALLASEVQLVVDPSTTSLLHILAGKLRALAIAGRCAIELPDVPTAPRRAIPKLSRRSGSASWRPPVRRKKIVAKLNPAFRDASRRRRRGKSSRTSAPSSRSARRTTSGSMLAEELALWRGVVKDAHITVE